MDGDFAQHTLVSEKPRQSRATRAIPQSTLPRPVPLQIPGFSIELLGRQLALSGYREHLLDLIEDKTGMTPEQQHPISLAYRAICAHTAALETLILASRPCTVPDVIVQLIVSHTVVHRAEYTSDDLERDQVCKTIRRVLSGATRVLGEAYAIPLADLGGTHWSAFTEDEWPDIDLAGEADPNGPRRAIDGSVTEWER